jgi:hypothetical protein
MITYVHRNRNIAAGAEATNVDIALIDNGLLDGFRDFRYLLTNGSPGLLLYAADFPWVRIERQ